MENFEKLKDAVLTENAFFAGIEYENFNSDGTHSCTHSCLMFKATNYKSSFFDNLQDFYQVENFCDVTLVTDGRTIGTNRLVLASGSIYFKTMFTGGFRENKQKSDVIAMNDICDYETLETIVRFFYTGKVLIKYTNVQYLLVASKILQVTDLENACCMFLYLNLDPANCIGIKEFSLANGCIMLSKLAQKYIENHFCQMIHSEEFLNLSEQQLCLLLRKDELSVKCESIVFKAVIDWVKHDPQNRSTHLDSLFQCVRFHLLPPKFLKEMMKSDDLQCKEADKGKSYLQRVFDDLISHKPCPSKPRKEPFNFSLFVLGGYQKKSLNLVECFKKTTMSWERCADMRTPRSGVACVSHSLHVYVIGGRNSTLNSPSDNVDCADVECYNPFLNMWKRCAPMSVPRSRAGAGILDHQIYVAGGAQGSEFHASVERYSPQENKWETVSPMAIKRMGLGCAVVNRLLYAVGGYDGRDRLNQTECYNPDQNTWYFVAPMHTARSGAGVCSLENFIYVIGGYTTNLQLNTCERYDTLTNQWTFISSLSTSRSALACVTWNGTIMAIGGYNGAEFLTSVEEYCKCTDKWTEGLPMLSERSGHGAAVSVECTINN